MTQSLVAIRGATTIEANELLHIKKETQALVLEIIDKNGLDKNSIISMQFYITDDITKASPARFVRELEGFNHIGFTTANEAKIENNLPLCIRVLVFAYSSMQQKEIHHIYLKNARTLRPDLAKIN